MAAPVEERHMSAPTYEQSAEKVNVLLVDDVLTTGTTVSECARILRKADAKQVWVATVARTLKNSSANFEIEPDSEMATRA